MNKEYQILWIEDSPGFIESTIELLEDIVKNNNMIPRIKAYDKFEDFKASELENFDIDIFNLYDQIIIDFALSGTTGDKIIRDLRSRNIFTDIVFYSSNYTSMLQEIKNNGQLDGVFFAKRENLTSVVDNVIKKNLKREYSIANIRGLIMDSTSEFDFICRTTTLALFDKISKDKQIGIISKAKEYVEKAQSKSNGNFSDLSSKNGKQFLKKAIESVDYVMDNQDRYAIMSMVVREFEGDSVYNDDYATNYHKNIIKPRNDLAHNKLYYGECKKKLHIAKNKDIFECNKDCVNCSSKYSIERCEEIRKLIFHYYTTLKELDEKLATYL